MRARKDPPSVAMAMSAVGAAFHFLRGGALDLAERAAVRAIRFATEANEPMIQAAATIAHARVLWDRGRTSESIRRLRQARNILGEGALREAIDVERELSRLTSRDENEPHHDGIEPSQCSTRQQPRNGQDGCFVPTRVLWDLVQVARLSNSERSDEAQKRLEHVVSELSEALVDAARQDLDTELGDESLTAAELSDLQMNRAEALLAANRIDEALEMFERAQHSAELSRNPQAIAAALYPQAEVLAELQRPARALRLVKRVRVELATRS